MRSPTWAAGLALLVALTLSHCTPSSPTTWPLPDWPGTAAYLVHLRADEAETLIAFDRTSAPAALPFADRLDQGVEATVLGLERALAAYAIPPGPQTLVDARDGRPWPPIHAAARRTLGDEAWEYGLRLEDTALVGRSLDASPVCPPVDAEPHALSAPNPADIIALDRRRALVATDAALWTLGLEPWSLTEQPLPSGVALRALWLGADGTIVAGATRISRVFVGRWDRETIEWTDEHPLEGEAALVAVVGEGSGPVYGVTSRGQVLRTMTGPARSDTLFSFGVRAPNSGAGIALRGPGRLVAYSNVEAGRVLFLEPGSTRVEQVFPGPLNVFAGIPGLGVVAGNALGFSVLPPDAVAFVPLGPAPLEPQAIAPTRDGFFAFGTNGQVVRYDRRSGHLCRPVQVASGEFRAAVALDDETLVALAQPNGPGQPITAWRLRARGLEF